MLLPAALLLCLASALPQSPFVPAVPQPARPELGAEVQAARPDRRGGRTKLTDLAERVERGRALFDRNFNRSAGLGTPDMNADSCRACHQDPILGGAGGLELNVSRIGRDHAGAGPFENVPGGQGLSKLRPPLAPGREEYELAEPDVFEQRQTPSILGDGSIDGIPDAAILANEDPLDLDGDGIRGVARKLVIDGRTEIGRFGWKAQVPRLADFVRDALGGELGLTSPDDGRGFALLGDADARPDPEVDEEQVGDLALFLASLPAPVRVGSLEPEVLMGELLFESIGCARCHVPELEGADGPVALYSDLLLHDIWPDSFRGMSEPDAGSGAFRTPPLWGIRDTAPYLHDGRASNLRTAILAHDGEALRARRAFEALPQLDKEALLAFLNDL